MLPVVVLVTGPRHEGVVSAAHALQVALPDVNVIVHHLEDESLAVASASSHLVLTVAELSCPSPGRYSDATARSLFDLERFVTRVKDFERRRVSQELPPDLPPSIAPWSAGWSNSAQRVGARVSHALTVRGVTASVDHIGSTSVPGLPAKEIIDLQVSVERLEDFDEADSKLKAAGFVNVQRIAPDAPGVRRDNPRGVHADSDQWEKRLYASVDADQRVIVHIRRVGAANWRYALLFRDWLRANDDERDEYARAKSGLAAAHSGDANFDGYARAKDFWFDDAYEKSEAWARRIGWQPACSGIQE